jgi:DNA-binding protein H-NS
MATINGLDKMSYAELLKLQPRVEAAIAERRLSDAAATKEQLRAMAEKAGFNLNELFGKRGQKKGSAGVKFRNPKDASQTWTGRGRKPNWLVDAQKKGAKIDSFAI